MAIHKIKIFSGRGSEYLAAKIASSFGTKLGQSEILKFSDGEFQPCFNESIRGKDLFFLVDVCNHSITYKMNGYINHKSPDDHYQDLKRIIAAVGGKGQTYYRNNALSV